EGSKRRRRPSRSRQRWRRVLYGADDHVVLQLGIGVAEQADEVQLTDRLKANTPIEAPAADLADVAIDRRVRFRVERGHDPILIADFPQCTLRLEAAGE